MKRRDSIMISIREYELVDSLEQAHEILLKNRFNTVIGGGAFLRLGSKKINKAIDLSRLKLDYIEEDEHEIRIGAMVTLRQLETSSALLENFSGAVAESVKHIVGVQLRNIVTVGGTVYSRYGFSDPITALLALETYVDLYKGGRMSLDDFLETGSPRDILTQIVIKKGMDKASFKMLRNSAGDYAILNVCAAAKAGAIRIVAGARPARAKLAKAASEFLTGRELSEENIDKAAQMAAEELDFGSNMRASADYRRQMCKVLVKRALMEV